MESFFSGNQNEGIDIIGAIEPMKDQVEMRLETAPILAEDDAREELLKLREEEAKESL